MQAIPLVDLKAQYATLAADLEPALRGVLGGMNLILGPELAAFEREFARYLGVPQVVGVGSGLDALVLALRATGLQPGDEVLVPALTFVATASAVVLAGGVPRFVDVSPDTLLMDLAAARAAITSRTRAIIPVHLYGQMVPMDMLMALAAEAGLTVIEDAAQAHGADYKGKKAGTWARAGCFSFYPGKNLGAYGEAGAIATEDERLAEKVRILRNQGAASKYEHVDIGVNSRMDELQAAILRIKLGRLEGWNERRRELASRYDELLADLPVRPVPVRHGTSARHLYVIRLGDRDRVFHELQRQGIGAGIHYPAPLHHQPALRRFATGPLPGAEAAAAEVLSLPPFPELSLEQQDRVVAALRDALGEHQP